MDDEASADERGRSPRGASSKARQTASLAERHLAEGGELWASRRGRVARASFGGMAFGVAAEQGPERRRGDLPGGSPKFHPDPYLHP